MFFTHLTSACCSDVHSPFSCVYLYPSEECLLLAPERYPGLSAVCHARGSSLRSFPLWPDRGVGPQLSYSNEFQEEYSSISSREIAPLEQRMKRKQTKVSGGIDMGLWQVLHSLLTGWTWILAVHKASLAEIQQTYCTLWRTFHSDS